MFSDRKSMRYTRNLRKSEKNAEKIATQKLTKIDDFYIKKKYFSAFVLPSKDSENIAHSFSLKVNRKP